MKGGLHLNPLNPPSKHGFKFLTILDALLLPEFYRHPGYNIFSKDSLVAKFRREISEREELFQSPNFNFL